jgi:hypothetical protein
MQFKNPEILYALFLLLIPVIVHLFQLRKFKKQAFTNVQFLKEVSAQSRKSSQLKKWLILSTRLLALAAIVFAFAQPFLSKTTGFATKKEQVIYLDNSFSMQAKGAHGALYKRAIQELLSAKNDTESFTLFTNDKLYKNVSKQSIQNELLESDYSGSSLSFNEALLKGKSLFSKEVGLDKNLLLVSDFQQGESAISFEKDSLIEVRAAQLLPAKASNIAIDSLWVKSATSEIITLEVQLTQYGNENAENIAVSLYDKDVLLAKSSISFENQTTATTIFSLPANKQIDGVVSIDDVDLQFDNSFYFTLNQASKIKVLAVNEADAAFLEKIYTNDEFIYQATPFKQLDYQLIEEQNLIVLNELEDIPNSLSMALQAFVNKGGSLLVIPATTINLPTYNVFLQRLGSLQFGEALPNTRNITTINFNHPLLEGVFDKSVSNFQYPKVNSSYISQNANNNILLLDDGTPFISKVNKLTYVFTAAINTQNSNFKNSPLIVPILYNVGKESLKATNLYFTIGRDNQFDIPVVLGQDEILSLANGDNNIIPLQQALANKVRLTTDVLPSIAGNYSILRKDERLQGLSYNYDRTESVLSYNDMSTIKGIKTYDSLSETLTDLQLAYNVNTLWKWFVIFAAIFLIMEMLILKFLK